MAAFSIPVHKYHGIADTISTKDSILPNDIWLKTGTWDWDEILRIHATNFLGYTRRESAAQLRINIHTRSRVITIAHPVLTIPYVWRVTHEYINEGLKQGLKNTNNQRI